MKLEAISTTYRFTCEVGMKLNAEIAKGVLIGLNPSFGHGYRSVEFTVVDDNDTRKAQNLRNALWYAQKEI